MNIVTIGGRVGRDPESKMLQTGKLLTKFSIATTDWKNTNWHNITCFGQSAEYTNKYVKKGDYICVSGRIEYGEYEKDGVKVKTTDIIAERVESTFKKGQERPPGDIQQYEAKVTIPEEGLPF